MSCEMVNLVLSKNELIQGLLDLGKSGPDFSIVSSKESDLLLKQKVVDAKYYGLASVEEMTKNYRARMWLDEDRKEVRYQEVIEDNSKSVGVLPAPRMKFETSVLKGKVLFQKEKGITFGFRKPLDPTSIGKVVDYSFDVEKIRSPVRQLVENAGWKFNQIILSQ